MPADVPRVLVTGAGGPSGVSILRALEGTPVTLLAGDIDPYGAGLYIVDAAQRSILRRGDDPRFADDLLARCRRDAVDVRRPDRRQRAAAARAAARGVRRRRRHARARQRGHARHLHRQVGAGRALRRPRARARRRSSPTPRSTRERSRCR